MEPAPHGSAVMQRVEDAVRRSSPARSLRARIMVAVAVGILILLAVMGLNSYQMVRQLTDQLLQERLRSAQATAELLDGTLTQSFRQLQGLASSPALSAPGAAGQREWLREMQPQIALASYSLYVVDAAGRLRIAQPVRPGDAAIDFRNDEAVRRVLAGQPAAASNLEFLGPARAPAVLLCVPLSARAGALCAAVDLRRKQFLSYITEYSTTHRPGTTWHALIIDANGAVLATTEHAEAFQVNEHPLFHHPLMAAREAAVGRAAVVEGGQIHGYHIMAFAPLYQAAWGVSIGQTEAETFAPIVAVRNRNLLIGATALILALLLAWWDTGTAVRPLRSLAVAAQRIAGGDLDTTVRVDRHDEIGSLADAYDTMRDRLKTSLAERARREHVAQALYAVSREILALTDLRTILAAIAEHARRLLHMEAGALCLFNDRGGPIIMGALSGPPDARLPDRPGGSVGAPAGELLRCWEDRACPFIDGRYGRAHAVAPVQIGDRTLGTLCVASSEPRRVTPDDTNLLSGLAALAAIAVQSNELHQQVQQVAVLSERDRISRDLHDNTMQALYGVDLALEYATGLIDDNPGEAKRRLGETLDIHTRIIQEIRGYVHNLRPPETAERTFRTALAAIAGEFQEHSRLRITQDLEDADTVPPLPSEVRTQLVLIVREALANVIRHAQATRVTVQAAVADDVLTLRVRDDGRGFDPAGLSSRYGLGLGSMAERARAIGGRLRVTAAPGAGTTVEVSVPRPARAQVEVQDGEAAAHSAGG
ncbi:MAG: HAMP domain-containing protein [bacterium]